MTNVRIINKNRKNNFPTNSQGNRIKIFTSHLPYFHFQLYYE